MNDKELDELLNTWKTPAAPESLREGVRRGIAAAREVPVRKPFRGWKLLIAGAAVAAIAFVLADSSAFSEKTSPPYTVESEIVLDPGTPDEACEFCWRGDLRAFPGPKRVLMTSYNQAGSEVIVTWSAPDHPFEGAFFGAKLALSTFHRRLILGPDKEANDFAVVYTAVGQSHVLTERSALVNSGCRALPPRGGTIVGEEVILNYATVVAQYDLRRSRMIVWLAPELSCFALRARIERQQPDDSWIVESEKKALKVTLNP